MELILMLLAFAAGLVVGWNFLPQPEWVLNLWNKLFG
jgi:hypothetical protein